MLRIGAQQALVWLDTSYWRGQEQLLQRSRLRLRDLIVDIHTSSRCGVIALTQLEVCERVFMMSSWFNGCLRPGRPSVANIKRTRTVTVAMKTTRLIKVGPSTWIYMFWVDLVLHPRVLHPRVYSETSDALQTPTAPLAVVAAISGTAGLTVAAAEKRLSLSSGLWFQPLGPIF